MEIVLSKLFEFTPWLLKTFVFQEAKGTILHFKLDLFSEAQELAYNARGS